MTYPFSSWWTFSFLLNVITDGAAVNILTCAAFGVFIAVWLIIVSNSQKMGTTQMPISWWMGKWNVIYPYNGILFIKSNEVLIHPTTWVNLGKHYAVWKKSVIKDHILSGSTWNVQKVIFIDTECRLVVSRV